MKEIHLKLTYSMIVEQIQITKNQKGIILILVIIPKKIKKKQKIRKIKLIHFYQLHALEIVI